jgi:hypothetical protein
MDHDARWTGTSTERAESRLSGGREPSLRFDRTTTAVLALGRSGSGLSTFVHEATTNLAAHYSPGEVQLLLVGLGSSRQFEPYARRRLAHARLVGIEADRELALSALETATAEITRRLVMFQAAGVNRDGYEAYRRETGKALPRVIVAIDQVGELFAHRDTLSRKTDDLMTRITLDGAASGVHLLLSDHVDNNAAELLDRLPADGVTCVLLPANEDDARAVFGDNAPDVDLPHAPGDVVIASPDGRVAAGQFTATTDADRDATLRELRARAEADRVDREPRVVDGLLEARLDRAPLDLLRTRDRHSDGPRVLHLWLGEPLALGSPVEVQLTRDEGANLIVVARDENLAQGVLLSAMVTATLDADRPVELNVIDFMGLETGFGECALALDPPAHVSVSRRRSSEATIERVRNIVVNRLAKAEVDAPASLLVINGLEHAHDLEIGESHGKSNGGGLLAHLEQIVRDGPTVGVHTILGSRTRESLEERLSRDVVRRFAIRVVGQTDPASSAALVDTPIAAELRATQALLYDEVTSRLERFRPYGLTEPAWLKSTTGPFVNLTSSNAATDLR